MSAPAVSPKETVGVGARTTHVLLNVGTESVRLSATEARTMAEALRKAADELDASSGNPARGDRIHHASAPQPLHSALQLESDRQVRWLVALIKRWTEYQHYIAFALLALAVAACDSLGADVEAFVHELRRREPMPDVLVPPERTRS